MSNKCSSVVHRTVEGVLTYLNAFLILDLSRKVFQNSPGLAVFTIIVITMILYSYMAQHRILDCIDKPKHIVSPDEALKMRTTQQINSRRYR
jgi:hypothetical protein